MADTNNIQQQYEGNLARQSSGYDEHLYDVLSEMSKNLEKIARASVDSSQGTSRSRLNDESRRAAREIFFMDYGSFFLSFLKSIPFFRNPRKKCETDFNL